MAMQYSMTLKLPDGTTERIAAGRRVLGRGCPPAFHHPQLSREQLAVSIHPLTGEMTLEALGRNPLVLQQPAAYPGGTQEVQILEKGQYARIKAAGARFYIVSLEDESACEVLSCTREVNDNHHNTDEIPAQPAGECKHSTGGCNAGDVPQHINPSQPLQQAVLQQLSDHPVIDLNIDDDNNPASSDAATAQTQNLHVQSVVPQAGNDSMQKPNQMCEMPAVKRRKTNDVQLPEPQQDIKEPTVMPQGSQQQQIISSVLHEDTPFKLFRVRGIAATYNQGCLSASLSKLVTGQMKQVVIMNYMVDLLWLFSACPDLPTADQLLVCHGERATSPAESRLHQTFNALGLGGKLVLHRPDLPPYGTHHTKAFLIQYEHGLRVIVHTANLIHADCNYKTQGIWWQDFPLKDGQSPKTSSFEEYLVSYMTHSLHRPPCRLMSNVIQVVKAHDMSSARAALVASVPGNHDGVSLLKYGHMRLRHLLQQEPLPSNQPLSSWLTSSRLIMQCSSLGSLDSTWVHQEFAASLSASAPPPSTASSVEAEAGMRSTLVNNSDSSARSVANGSYTDSARSGTPNNDTTPSAPRNANAVLMSRSPVIAAIPSDRIHFIWPTVQEVRDSLEGWWAGGSIPGNSKNVDRDFLRRLMAVWGGQPVGRQRAMPHIKTYCRYLGQQLAWFMVGSHNLSKAAWGNLSKGKDGSQRLYIRSYELGTLHTPSLEAAYRCHRHYGFSCTDTQMVSDIQSTPVDSTVISPSPLANPLKSAPERVEFWSLDHCIQQQQQRCQTLSHGSTESDARVIRVAIPVPYLLPPQRYQQGVDQPWMVDVEYEGLDILGARTHTPRTHYGLTEEPWEE